MSSTNPFSIVDRVLRTERPFTVRDVDELVSNDLDQTLANVVLLEAKCDNYEAIMKLLQCVPSLKELALEDVRLDDSLIARIFYLYDRLTELGLKNPSH